MLAYLARQGHEICVLQEDRKYPKTREVRDFFRVPGDGIQTLWYNPARGVEKLLTFPVDRLVRRSPYRGNLGHRMWMIRVAAKQFRPDVVYCSEGFGYGVPAALLKRLGLLKPALVVQSIGGDFCDEVAADYGTRRTRVSRWLLNQVLRHSTVLKPVSPLLADIMREMGADDRKIQISPSHLVAAQSVLDHLYEQRAELGLTFRRRYSIPSDAPVIISLSGNWMGKGTQFIAEAWPKIREAVPGCCWILAGPQPAWFVQNVKPLVDRYPEEIVQTGGLHGEDVFHALVAADLNVNPTLADGLNMVVVEAAAVGTPSISTDKAGITDWVGQCKPNLVLPAGNVHALTAEVVAYFQQPISSRLALGQVFRAMSTQFCMERLGVVLTEIWVDAQIKNAKHAL